MEVCRQEFTDAILQRIRNKVSDDPLMTRMRLSRQVCEWMDWRRPGGKLKEMSCRVALLKLHRHGIIPLPAPRKGPARLIGVKAPAKFEHEPEPLNIALSELGEIEIVPVGSRHSNTFKTWKGLMDRYHYLGSGPLCGAQLRYLIRGDRYGWLGGLSFSAAAWKLQARDEWIGWADNIRTDNLDNVVCNSRFLILPHIRAPHLASHVLSLSVRRLGADWQKRYGIKPVMVETFVERGRFSGTSYRAANWVYVGCTSGRGRQDRSNKSELSIKDIYLYPLQKKAREVLSKGTKVTAGNKASTSKACEDWAEEEFGGVGLGDARLQKRLLTIARDIYGKPQANIPQACESRAKTKAAYRFFEHKETTMEKLLQPHYESTIRRMQGHKVVLAVQDTTSLNYTTHPETKGLGVIGSRPDKSIGLILHDTLAFSTDGTPLGILDVQCWARDRESFGKRHKRHNLPIEQKESNKWLKSFQTVAEAQKRCGQVTIVSVGDREADIYELFETALKDPANPKVLVRAERERLLAEGQGSLWEEVEAGPVAGVQVLRVPRRGNRPARDARLEVRFAEVTIKPPKRKPSLGNIRLWAVLANETESPDGVEPLRWMLLSTLEVNTFEQALEKLAWYAVRWGIEGYHKTLKSGCKIEERQFGSVDSIEACLAIDMVVAWRVFHLTKLGRETPNVPCTVFFEDAEWKALYIYKKPTPTLPAEPPMLREVVHMVASLGGFLGRKSDGEPGTKSLWLGLERLDDITVTWKHMAELYAPHLLIPTVSRSPGYG